MKSQVPLPQVATSSSQTVDATGNGVAQSTSQSIDWYSEGESRVVEVGSIKMTVRVVGRKGRRARISITAPAGAVFRADK